MTVSDTVTRAKTRMCVMSSRNPARLGVLADHVVGLPPSDVHEVVGRATRREPAVRERSPEPVRVDVLDSSLLAPAPHHVADTGVRHACRVVPLDTKPEPRRRRLRMPSPRSYVLIHCGGRLLADRHPGLVSSLEADTEPSLSQEDI